MNRRNVIIGAAALGLISTLPTMANTASSIASIRKPKNNLSFTEWKDYVLEHSPNEMSRIINQNLIENHSYLFKNFTTDKPQSFSLFLYEPASSDFILDLKAVHGLDYETEIANIMVWSIADSLKSYIDRNPDISFHIPVKVLQTNGAYIFTSSYRRNH